MSQTGEQMGTFPYGPDVSVIIVSYNTRELTVDCVRSVFAQTRDVSLEVFVVDNASTDGSAAAIAVEFPQVRLIANTENRGFAAANNQAMRIASGRYVLLLNPDALVRESAINKCLAYMDAHLDIGVLGCLVQGADNQRQSTCFRVPSLRRALLDFLVPVAISRRSKLLGRARYVGCDWSQIRDVEVVAGCFMLVRREVLDQAGLFDSNYFMYQEEVDWCYRIRRAGWRIVYYPHAHITHYGGRSADQVSEEMLLAQVRSRLYFMRKHCGRASAACLNLLLLLQNLTRVPFVWLAPVMPGTQLGRRLTLSVLRRRLALHARAIFSLEREVSTNA